MGRIFLLGAAAILLFAGAVAAIVWRATMPEPPHPVAPLEPPPPVPRGTPPPALASGPVSPTVPAPARPERPSGAQPVGRPQRTPGELFSVLGPLGTNVASCATRSTGPSGSLRQAVLVLDLLPLAGAVKIVDASPLQRSAESETLARCARSEMVGRELPLASARPGRAYKMSYSVRY